MRRFICERGSTLELTATLAFYNDEGKSLDKLPIRIETKAEGDKLLAVEASSEINLAGYAYAALESVGPEPISAFLPPNLSVQDDTGVLAIGINEMVEDGAFTRIVFDYAVLKEETFNMEAELLFFDGNGRELGKTVILLGDSGAERNGFGLMPDNVYTMETAAKGRVAGSQLYSKGN